MATATAKTRGRNQRKPKAPDPTPKKKRAKKGQANNPVSQATFLATVTEQFPGITADEMALKFNWPAEDVDKRRWFVLEYVKDFDAEAAALRMGYPSTTAKGTGKLFLGHSYTRKKLDELLSTRESAAVVNVSQVMSRLWQEANAPDVAFSSNSSTRISALKTIAQALGMLQPKAKEPDEAPVVRVMVIPATASLVDWEQGARGSQKALVESAAIDV